MKRIKYKSLFEALSSSIFEENYNNPYALDQLIKYGRECMSTPCATDEEVYQAIRQALDKKYLPLLDKMVIIYAPKWIKTS